jgi:hypothetical protein
MLIPITGSDEGVANLQLEVALVHGAQRVALLDRHMRINLTGPGALEVTYTLDQTLQTAIPTGELDSIIADVEGGNVTAAVAKLKSYR